MSRTWEGFWFINRLLDRGLKCDRNECRSIEHSSRGGKETQEQSIKESQTPKAKIFSSTISFHFPTRSARSLGDTSMMARRKSASLLERRREFGVLEDGDVPLRAALRENGEETRLLVRGGLSVMSGPEEGARWVPFREGHDARELPIQHGGDPATFPIVEQIGEAQILVRRPKLHPVQLFGMLCQRSRDGVEARQNVAHEQELVVDANGVRVSVDVCADIVQVASVRPADVERVEAFTRGPQTLDIRNLPEGLLQHGSDHVLAVLADLQPADGVPLVCVQLHEYVDELVDNRADLALVE